MQSKVSVRGQTVIPSKIRKSLGITTNTVLRWKVRNGVINVYPVPSDPVKASRGILRGRWSYAEFIRDRERERAKELAQDEARF